MVVDQLPTDQADRVFHALADATRRDILLRTLEGQHNVSALARRYPMSFAAVQKHVDLRAEGQLPCGQNLGPLRFPHCRERPRLHRFYPSLGERAGLLE